jgi:hypothetical protein
MKNPTSASTKQILIEVSLYWIPDQMEWTQVSRIREEPSSNTDRDSIVLSDIFLFPQFSQEILEVIYSIRRQRVWNLTRMGEEIYAENILSQNMNWRRFLSSGK